MKTQERGNRGIAKQETSTGDVPKRLIGGAIAGAALSILVNMGYGLHDDHEARERIETITQISNDQDVIDAAMVAQKELTQDNLRDVQYKNMIAYGNEPTHNHLDVQGNITMAQESIEDRDKSADPDKLATGALAGAMLAAGFSKRKRKGEE